METVDNLCVSTDDGEVGNVGMPARLVWVLYEGARKFVDKILTSPNLSIFQKVIKKKQCMNLWR